MNKKSGPIRNFVAGIFDGPHATPKESSTGPVFLGISNVTEDGRLDLTEIKHVSEAEYPHWTKRVIPQENDVVFSYEATLHRYAIIPHGFCGCLGRRMGLVRVDPRKILPRFLLYYFLSPAWKSVVEANIVSGATVDRIPIKKFPDFHVAIPSIPEQRRIVDILSAYDDLIENNRKRIEFLEESARLIYRQRFGGSVDCSATRGKVSDFFNLTIGRTPPRKNEEVFSTMETDLKWLSIKDMRSSRVFALDTAEKLTKAGIEKTRIHISPPGTIFLSFKLTVGEVVIAGDSMATNEAIAHFETTDRALRDYTYFYLSSFQYDKLGSTSSIAKAINSDLVRKMDFVLPSRDALDHFGRDVAPMIDQIEKLSRQNIVLAAARDALLPRLLKRGVA